MKEGPHIALVASLIGDPARANMLSALIGNKALTASELAHEAGVTLQTASFHLGKLEQGSLICPRKQGRHKYFALAGDEVAHALEALMGIAANAGHLRIRPGPKDVALRQARVCYNHLAGEMATRFFDSMISRRFLSLEGEDVLLTAAGACFVRNFGIELDALTAKRPPLCRQCLDWSERRFHLGGSLGRAILARIVELGWAKREQNTRVLVFSRRGQALWVELIGKH
ncbi:MAG: ArsR/SmtB family transcription factor [Rhizomicrobium sp.]